MKTWEPEEIFEKADFPSKKEKEDRPQKKTVGKAPVSGAPGTVAPSQAATGPASGGSSPDRMAPGGAAATVGSTTGRTVSGKSVTFKPAFDRPVPDRGAPDRDSPGRKTPGKPADQGPSLNRGGAKEPASGKKKIFKGSETAGGIAAWQPERISAESAHVVKAAPSRQGTTADRKQTSAPDATPTGGARIIPAGSAKAAPAGRGGQALNEASQNRDLQEANRFSLRLFQEAALTNMENAVHLLRRWYWEKETPPAARSGIKLVKPHDRIQIVFTSLDEKIRVYLFQLMSPTERAQIVGILKRPAKFAESEINLVRREFMNAIIGDMF